MHRFNRCYCVEFWPLQRLWTFLLQLHRRPSDTPMTMWRIFRCPSVDLVQTRSNPVKVTPVNTPMLISLHHRIFLCHLGFAGPLAPFHLTRPRAPPGSLTRSSLSLRNCRAAHLVPCSPRRRPYTAARSPRPRSTPCAAVPRRCRHRSSALPRSCRARAPRSSLLTCAPPPFACATAHHRCRRTLSTRVASPVPHLHPCACIRARSESSPPLARVLSRCSTFCLKEILINFFVVPSLIRKGMVFTLLGMCSSFDSPLLSHMFILYSCTRTCSRPIYL